MTRFEKFMLILLGGEFGSFLVANKILGYILLGCIILIYGAREIILDLKK